MIPAKIEVLDEMKANGLLVCLTRETFWSPENSQIKFKITAENEHLESVAEWDFDNEEQAMGAFNDYLSLAGE